jgi:hypothetical protein
MSTDTRQLPDFASWQAMQLQLITFPKAPQLNIEQNWWRDLMGEEPEEQSRKRMERTDQGPFHRNALVLTVDVIRVIWTVAPRIDAENLPEGPPLLGTFVENRVPFCDLMATWLGKECPPVTRIGFAGRFFLKTPSHEDSYRLLDAYLPGVAVDPASTDFQYRINRKRLSKAGVAELLINRLVTWSPIKFSMQVRAQGPGVEAPGVQLNSSDSIGIVAELDINTAIELLC